MAGIRSIFVSAPKVKIKIGGRVLAYAIGLSLSIDVSVENVFTFSRYDSAGPEPLQYGLVSGSIQIVKLNLVVPSNSALKLPADATAALNTYRLADHLDPTRVMASETFDFEIIVNHFLSGAGFNGAVDPEIDLAGKNDYSLYEISNCRIGGSNINISLGSLINEPISFQGLLLVDSDDHVSNGRDKMSSDDLTRDGN